MKQRRPTPLLSSSCSIAPPLKKGIAVLSLLVFCTGCAVLPSHLHNDANQATSEKLVTAMAAISAATPNRTKAMLANVDQFRVEEEKMLGDFAANHHAALVTALCTLTHKQLRERIKNDEDSIKAFDALIASEASKFLKETAASNASLVSAKQAISAINQQIQQAKADVTRWNRDIAVMRDGFASLPEKLKTQNSKGSLKELAAAASSVGATVITYQDADGKIVKAKLSTILGDELSQASGSGGSKAAPAGLPDAPGITITILNLGLDLAKIEQARAQARLAALHSRAIVCEDAAAEIDLARQLLIDAADGVGGKDADDDKPFLRIVDAWADAKTNIANLTAPKDKNDEQKETKVKNDGHNSSRLLNGNDIVSKELKTIRLLAHAELIIARGQSILPVTLARMKHEESISISGVIEKKHQAVVARGLEGLAAYHKAGFSKEDAMKIIQLAQAVAVGAIAHNTR